jgi:hypothetical protein
MVPAHTAVLKALTYANALVDLSGPLAYEAEARTRRRPPGPELDPVHNLEGSAHQETQLADGRSRSMTSEF